MSVNIRFPREVHEQLAALAKDERRSFNQTVVVAAERYIRSRRGRQPKEER